MSLPADIVTRVVRLERDAEKEEERLDRATALADKHETELHGERGVYFALRQLADELKWTRRALWGLAAALIVASVVFALGSIGAPG